MAVYVDDYRALYKGMIVCHMVADDIEELHQMAKKLKLDDRWFQGSGFPHYDVCLSMRKRAIKRGAIPCGRDKLKELIRKRVYII